SRARIDVLVDGAIVAAFSPAGAATDSARDASQAALLLRRLLPRWSIAIATGRGEVVGSTVVGDAIDRASLLLDRDAGEARRPAAVLLDDTTAGLLDPRFEVRGDERGLVLACEHPDSGSVRKLLGRPSPCVGREAELGALES